jgi:hypothetical protein
MRIEEEVSLIIEFSHTFSTFSFRILLLIHSISFASVWFGWPCCVHIKPKTYLHINKQLTFPSQHHQKVSHFFLWEKEDDDDREKIDIYEKLFLLSFSLEERN